ncbi:MAG: hypothetical protein ABI579_05955 [Candidatus Sumerlaeota bacterium]
MENGNDYILSLFFPENAGRNIESEFEVGKGESTRSDIDFRFNSNHLEAENIIEDLKGVGNNAGSAGPNPKWNTALRATYPPYIRFSPGAPVQHVLN